MKLLLDTHAFIWWAEAPERLPASLVELLCDPQHRLLLSMASLWEMQIKTGLGKLLLNQPLPEIVDRQRKENSLELLGIDLPHLWQLSALPPLHGDPFDRLLVAQTMTEDLTLVSRDAELDGYGVTRLWQS